MQGKDQQLRLLGPQSRMPEEGGYTGTVLMLRALEVKNNILAGQRPGALRGAGEAAWKWVGGPAGPWRLCYEVTMEGEAAGSIQGWSLALEPGMWEERGVSHGHGEGVQVVCLWALPCSVCMGSASSSRRSSQARGWIRVYGHHRGHAQQPHIVSTGMAMCFQQPQHGSGHASSPALQARATRTLGQEARHPALPPVNGHLL